MRFLSEVRCLSTALLCGIAIAALPVAHAQSPVSIEVRQAVKHDISKPLRDIPARPEFAGEAQERPPKPLPLNLQAAGPDGAIQNQPSSALNAAQSGSFDGVGIPNYSVNSAPSDTNGSVGKTQYVQWVNVDFAVFDKNTGNMVYGPTAGNSLWTGFGGPCETYNDGDPIVLYDKAAQRWIFAQFAVSQGTPYMECVAVSTTSDATGSYARYAFSYTNFNDYPKIGVWPDGYYVTYNMFNATNNRFAGGRACAWQRSQMLIGGPATEVCAQLSTAYGGLLPGDLDGSTPPPANSPDYFVAFGTNSLFLWKFSVNWANPTASTFSGPTTLAVSSFSPACGGGTCIPQSGTTQQLDSLADRLMYRLAYRNFGDHESLVVNHSVTVGSSVGVRWYELRSPGTSPVVYQQSTFAPDSTYRWMGSVAMDRNGDMLMGYSASSSSINPGIRITGRLATDPLNTMETETDVYDGGGSQFSNTRTLSRWGDYSSVSVDPSDDCTFWFTTEYLKNDGVFNWSTHIAKYNFATCAPLPASPVISATAGNAQVTLSWSAVANATSYKIYRGTSSGSETLLISGISTAGYTDNSDTNGTQYFYEVSGVDSSGEGPLSNEVSATPQVPAPSAPSGVTATAGNGQIGLTWNAVTGATSYKVYRGTVSGAETLLISGITSNGYTDNSVSNGTAYFYKISAVNAGGESPLSAEVSATPQVPAPSVPTGVSATPGNSQVALAWSAVTGATSYKVYRGTATGTETVLVSGITSTGYSDTGVINGTTYFYRVSALNAGGESPLSSEVSATPFLSVPPPVPSGLALVGGNSQVSLSWTASTGATSYNVYRATSSGGETLLSSSNTNSFVDNAVTNGNTYYYQVSAVGPGGESAKSSESVMALTTVTVDFGSNGQAFTKDQGYILNNSGVTDPSNYSVLVRFSIDSTANWIKLLDFHQGTYDQGLYAYNGYLRWYPWASNLSTQVLQPGQAVTLVATHAPNNLVNLYANGQFVLSFTDSNPYNLLAGALWVLKDDNTTGGNESSSGVLYKIQTFNGVLTASDVARLNSLVPPSGLAAVSGNSQVSLSWSASAGATSYNIYRGSSSGGETLLASSSTNSYLDNAVTNGSTYYYEVTAVVNGVETSVSAEVNTALTTTTVDFGTNGQSFSKDQGYILNSPGVTDPSNYSVVVRFSVDSVANWVKLLDFNQGTYDAGLYTNNGYLRWYPWASNLSSLAIQAGQAVTLVATHSPNNKVTLYENGQVVLSFTDSNPYNLLSGALWILKDDNTTSGNESSSGVLYKVQTFNGVLTAADVARLISQGPVTGLAAVGGNSQVSLNWSASSGATSYNIYRGTSSGAETLLASATTNSYLDNAVTNGSTYYYEVSAVTNGVESALSPEVSVALTTFSIDFGAGGQSFSKRQGYVVNTPGVTDPTNYSVLFRFSVDSIVGWVKLLDFNQGTYDKGLYSDNGYLSFYPWATNSSTLVLQPAQAVTVVATHAPNNLVNVYANGQFILSFTDSSPYNLLSGALWVLKDDTASGGVEASSGILYRIQIFNGVLTQSDVTRLNP